MRNVEAIAEALQPEEKPQDTTLTIGSILEKMMEMYTMLEQIIPTTIDTEEVETEEPEETETETETETENETETETEKESEE